jgi:asparagine synthase (glutamine-hydrolysing)
MCGIAGILKSEGHVTLPTLSLLSRTLIHRGPDGEGVWINSKKSIGFVHRRLSIIDLSSNARQPMHSFDNRYVLTFNGEIYNYIELRTLLLNKGYKFNTNSDTEVLLSLYHCYGCECLTMLDGMFAFAIWDNLEEQLFIARDRFGEKPLYYTFQNGTFYFASEIKALFSLGIRKESYSPTWYNYIANGNIHNSDEPKATFYKDIFQIENATYIIIDNNSTIIKEVTYWSIDNIEINTKISFTQAVDQFKQIFDESVFLRLRSDVPIGSSLSGGLDSSAIVLTANKYIGPQDIQSTFSARFENFALDEGVYIDYVASSVKNIHKFEVYPTSSEFLADFDNLCYYQDEPFTSASVYAQYAVMKLAKQNNVTVLLDGQGADEQLGGYLHYYHYKLNNLFLNNDSEFFNEKNKYNALHIGKDSYSLPKRILYWKILKLFHNKSVPYTKNLKSLLKKDTQNGLLQSLLRYCDRNSMAFSREIRLPFLSHKLVDFIASLPIEFLLNEGWTKLILRKAEESIVPSQIIWRKDKIGYEPPQDLWVKEITSFISEFKANKKIDDYTNGTPVSNVTNWHWLMINKFY